MFSALIRRLVPALFLVFAAAALPAAAGTISLAWDPVTSGDLAGYRLYYGTSPGQYTQTTDVGLVTQTVLTGLSDCTTYYIAVKAVGQNGLESADYSNVVSGWARPSADSANPAQVMQGSQAQLVVDGANFQAGASVQLSSGDVTVNSVTVNDCRELVLDITVSDTAALGPVDVTVVNPTQVFGSATGLLTVAADTVGPVITAVQSGNVASTTATITWTTDEPSDSQVFFREVGESTYQQTTVDPAAVTGHSVSLTGLMPGTEYEFHVRSVDASGNGSTANGGLTFTTLQNGYTYLRIEAESSPLSSPLEGGSGVEAFAGEWVALAEGTPNGDPNDPAGTIDLGFHLPSQDTWYLWFRVYGPDSSADGWLEAVDGGQLDYVDPPQSGEWQWVAARSYALDAGLHTLTIGGHEGGACVDRVLVTDDPSFIPTEQPGADVSPPATAAALTATPGDGEVLVQWTNPGDQDFVRVVVSYRTDGRSPLNPLDGYPVIDRAATAGANESLTHTGLTNGTTYHYGVFAIDGAGNAAAAAAAQATPAPAAVPPDDVTELRRTDVM